MVGEIPSVLMLGDLPYSGGRISLNEFQLRKSNENSTGPCALVEIIFLTAV